MDRIDNLQIRNRIFHKYNGHCAYCGCEILRTSFNIDHIKPLRRGDRENKGENLIINYNPSCISCNSSKGTLSIESWRKELLLKIIRQNRDSAQYRLIKRFGLITETGQDVIFYYEKHEANG